jgi:hypothetical protein
MKQPYVLSNNKIFLYHKFVKLLLKQKLQSCITLLLLKFNTNLSVAIKYCISSKYPMSKIQILLIILLQESEMVHFINKTVANESKLAFKL